MAQEVNTLTTNNSAGSGFFGSFFSGLGSLVSSAAPAAENLYQLKVQGQTLKNQTAGQLAQLQLQQQQLAAQNQIQQTQAAAAMKAPAWLYPVLIGGFLLLAVLLIVRSRQRS